MLTVSLMCVCSHRVVRELGVVCPSRVAEVARALLRRRKCLSLSHIYRGSAHADNLFQDWSAPLTRVSLCIWWGQLLPVTALLTVGLFTSLHTEGIKLLMAA